MLADATLPLPPAPAPTPAPAPAPAAASAAASATTVGADVVDDDGETSGAALPAEPAGAGVLVRASFAATEAVAGFAIAALDAAVLDAGCCQPCWAWAGSTGASGLKAGTEGDGVGTDAERWMLVVAMRVAGGSRATNPAM